MRLHGTFVPLYGLNNMFGKIPIFGLFLGGGSNEGLVGITYEASGPPERAAHQRQSDVGGGARPVAQIDSGAGCVRSEIHLRPTLPRVSR